MRGAKWRHPRQRAAKDVKVLEAGRGQAAGHETAAGDLHVCTGKIRERFSSRDGEEEDVFLMSYPPPRGGKGEGQELAVPTYLVPFQVGGIMAGGMEGQTAFYTHLKGCQSHHSATASQ